MLVEEITKQVKYKRPPKTLHFNNQRGWEYDIKIRFPQVELIEYDNVILALDPSTNLSYGKWDKHNNKGQTFHSPRTINVSVHPTHIRKIQKKIRK